MFKVGLKPYLKQNNDLILLRLQLRLCLLSNRVGSCRSSPIARSLRPVLGDTFRNLNWSFDFGSQAFRSRSDERLVMPNDAKTVENEMNSANFNDHSSNQNTLIGR